MRKNRDLFSEGLHEIWLAQNKIFESWRCYYSRCVYEFMPTIVISMLKYKICTLYWAQSFFRNSTEQIVFSTLLSVAKTLSRIDPPALELRVGCKVSVTMRCTARRDGRMLTVRTEMLLIVPRRVGAPRKPPLASRDGQLASVCAPHLLLSLCTSE